MGARFTIRDDSDFDNLEAALSSPNTILREIAQNLAEESINLVREGFDGASDPYGGGWAATRRGNKPLHGPTGALRTSYSIRSAGSRGFVIGSGVGYANYHQRGTSRMVARKMVPDDDIPGAWRAAYDDVAEDILEDHLGT